MIYHSISKTGRLCLNMKYIDNNKIYTYKVKHAFEQKCIRHSLPLLLNNLPEIVKEKLISHSTQGFAKYVKSHFSQNYQVAYTIQDCYVYMQH